MQQTFFDLLEDPLISIAEICLVRIPT